MTGFSARDVSNAFDDGYETAIEDIAEFARGFLDGEELTPAVLLDKLEYQLEWRFEDNAEELG